MSHMDKIRPFLGKPTTEIAMATGLDYKQVYDTLKWHGLKPVGLPKGMCRNGHIAPKVKGHNGRSGVNKLCTICKRERSAAYEAKRRRIRAETFRALMERIG